MSWFGRIWFCCQTSWASLHFKRCPFWHWLPEVPYAGAIQIRNIECITSSRLHFKTLGSQCSRPLIIFIILKDWKGLETLPRKQYRFWTAALRFLLALGFGQTTDFQQMFLAARKCWNWQTFSRKLFFWNEKHSGYSDLDHQYGPDLPLHHTVIKLECQGNLAVDQAKSNSLQGAYILFLQGYFFVLRLG